MSKNTFYYEDGLENIFNDNGEKVVDPMEDVLTYIIDPNIVLAITMSQAAYLAAKPEDIKDTEMEDVLANKVKLAKAPVNSPVKRGRMSAVARELGIKNSTAKRWWEYYQETGEVPYKKSEKNVGRPHTFTEEHEEYIQEIVKKDPQLCAVDIIDSLTSKFEDFSISKSQMNHHLKNNMFITVKKPTFEAKIRNSDDNLQTRYEWFMKWKDSDIDFEKNCVFIDEAGFNINMRSNWARSTIGTPAFVELDKARAPSHTIIGAIHSSSVIHVAMKKTPPTKEGKGSKTCGKAGEIIIEEPIVEYVEVESLDDKEANKTPSKGTTTAHFIKFMNELLDIMDIDESLKGSYLVMDNCTIHKSHPMIRKIEGRGYRVMYLPPYSPELNAIKNFWAIVKRKKKRENLMTEETLSQRIADACNNVRVSDLCGFCGHSKHHITYCRDKIHF
ncbi:hypothetical protein G6F60_009883 [Rhizopus arrhizus]|nr:hypothetical protein G6F60_009883 [Rhizopus arrhizus]